MTDDERELLNALAKAVSFNTKDAIDEGFTGDVQAEAVARTLAYAQSTTYGSLSGRVYHIGHPTGRDAVRAVSVNMPFTDVLTAVYEVRDWLELSHECTFDVAVPVRVDCLEDYSSIKAALLAQGVDLSIPTYAYAPGQEGPGSFGDMEQLAVKEVVAEAVVAHELAHIWTNTGIEAHGLEFPPDTDGNPFNDTKSVLGLNYTQFPQVRLLPEHLQAALSNGYIRRLT